MTSICRHVMRILPIIIVVIYILRIYYVRIGALEHRRIVSKVKENIFGTEEFAKYTLSKTKFGKWIASKGPKRPAATHSKLAEIDDIPSPVVNFTNCKELFMRKLASSIPSSAFQTPPNYLKRDTDYHHIRNHCDAFVNGRKYLMHPVSKEEAEFPLAFSILMYKSVQQVEQLLRAIYRPQNYYCIHVDAGASHAVFLGMQSVASCFENVFLTSKSYHVRWGSLTVLLPEIQCMRELWNKTDWRYFINLTGQEFPLKTNGDLVRILKAMNGANAVDFNLQNNPTFSYRTRTTWDGTRHIGKWKGPPPYNMSITYGSVHIAPSRAFVDFVIHSQVAADFLTWVSDTRIPDETFFASLQINPQLGVPGAFTGNLVEKQKFHNPGTRFKIWSSRCRKGNRNVCILDVRELANLADSSQMFANKFYIEHEPATLLCLEELHFNRTRENLNGERVVDVEVYKQLTHVKYHA